MAFARTAVSITGTLTNGSASVTSVSSTAQLFTGMLVYGVGIQADTLINTIAGTTITLSRNATASGSTVITGQYITQTGTDTNLSGLQGLTGVTSIVSGTSPRYKAIYDVGTNQLRFQGTVTHDPDQEMIVSGLQNGVRIESGTYNFGVVTTINGKTSYSKSSGFELTYNGGLASQFPIQLIGGTFNWRGGIIRLAGAWSMSGGVFNQQGETSIIYNTNLGSQIQIRSTLLSTNMSFSKIRLAGVNSVFFWTTNSYSSISANMENGAIQTPAGLGTTQTYADFSFANNQATADFYLNQLSGTSSTLSIVKNPDVIPRVSQLNTGAYGVVETRAALTFNVTDPNGVSAANVVGYVKDSNNGARTNENQLTNYTNDQVYIASSTVGGALSLGDVLVDVQMRNPSATNTVKHDYRSNYGNGSTDFNVFLGGYEFNPVSTRQSLIGNGGKTVSWTLFSDTDITLSRAAALSKLASSFVVGAVSKTVTVTANSTYDDVYDVLKAWKYNGTQVNAESPTINTLVVSADGENLTAAAGWTLVVNSGVTLSGGSKFTYIYFPTITNNGSITGVYASTAGTSTIWEFRELLLGAYSACAVWDGSGNTLLHTRDPSSTIQRLYLPPGSTLGTLYYGVAYYGKRFEYGTFPANAGGVLFYVPDYQDDVGITEPTLATVEAYTAIDTSSKFYDRAGAFKLTEQGIKLGDIAVRSGTAIETGSYSILVKQNASSVFGVVGSLITIKSTSFAGDSKYLSIIATAPATVTADTNEVITIDIEDANGNSSVTLNGGDGTFELWKIPALTATNDYETGTLLDTASNEKFRFIGIAGFDMVGVDINSNIRRRISMAKGVYTMAFYVGDQIQLAQAPQVIENGIKLDVLQVDLDALITDVEAIKGAGFASTDSLVAINSNVKALPLLSEIEASTLLAKESSITALGSPLQADDYLAPDNAKIATIDTNVASIGVLVADLPLLSEIEASTVLAKESSITALGAPLQADDYLAPDNATIAEIQTKVDTLQNVDLSNVPADVWAYAVRTLTTAAGLTEAQVALLEGIKAKTDLLPAQPAGVGDAMTLTTAYDASKTAASQSSVNALGAPLQAGDYQAPDNAGIAVLVTDVGNVPLAVRQELATELARIDVEVSSRSDLTVEDIPEGLTVAEIEASTVLAKEKSVQNTMAIAASRIAF